MVATIESQSTDTVIVTSLEQNVWDDVRAQLTLSLNRLKIGQLEEPTFFLLYQLVEKMINMLHYDVFKQAVQLDFGIGDIDDYGTELDVLFQSELGEHGDQNIARFCQLHNLHICLSFSGEANVIITINAPDCCKEALQISYKITKTLGYEFRTKHSENDINFFTVELVKLRTDQHALIRPTFITTQGERSSYLKIMSQISCGIVCFSSLGTVLTVSPSIFTLLNLESNDESIDVFCRSISIQFYNDVIWGKVLHEPNGKFENYRVRLLIDEITRQTTLFNVSGFCADDGIIHTLWQKISLDGNDTNNLSEGDLLNEAKVHNITRCYVPQLVEKRAREVVRLGGNQLKNEECHIAVLFCDIVGFTTFVEQNEEEESIIHVLNSILRRISLSVKNYGGFIDKFMGDCIMALFRNPHDAVMAALEMQKHSYDIGALRERAELDKLELRIGIHWGKVIIGNVGTPERLDWTTIGDVVNTASRIEKNCQPGSVLISKKMYEATENTDEVSFKCGNIFYIGVKGKKADLAVCYAYSIK